MFGKQKRTGGRAGLVFCGVLRCFLLNICPFRLETSQGQPIQKFDTIPCSAFGTSLLHFLVPSGSCTVARAPLRGRGVNITAPSSGYQPACSSGPQGAHAGLAGSTALELASMHRGVFFPSSGRGPDGCSSARGSFFDTSGRY